MMQTGQFLQPLWPRESSMDSSLDALEGVEIYLSNMETQLGSFEYFPSPTVSLENSSQSDSLCIPFESTLCADDLHGFLGSVDDVPLEDLCSWMDTDHLSTPASSCEDDDAGSSSPCQISLVFPTEEMEIDNQLSILYLLKAYGEAMEMERTELTGEILKRLREKACPLGVPVERLAYYLIQALDTNDQADYLREASSKNYQAAFQAFYQIFPYGRFAHFAANSMILESIPEDAESVHIVDFDVGEGVQWPPLIELLGRRRHPKNRLVQLTFLKWQEENCSTISTKKHLYEHAQSVGVTLIVKETNMEGLVSEMRRNRNGKEWLAFNCMVGLPQMIKSRSAEQVTEFLKIARNSIESTSNRNRGVIAFGDGTGEDNTVTSNGFGAYFENQMVRLKALFESMEYHLPRGLGEARMAMESTFLARCAGSVHKEEIGHGVELEKMGLKALRLSKNNVVEAKEVAREGESLFWVGVDGLEENQMVLGYMGASLVRVSSWSWR